MPEAVRVSEPAPPSRWWQDVAPRVGQVLDHAEELLGPLPPTLAGHQAQLLARLDAVSATGRWRDIASNLNLFPLIPLQLWLARALGLDEGDPRVIDVAAGSWLGYCGVRVTDDAVDEPEQGGGPRLLLADLYYLAFQAQLYELFPPGSPFWGGFRARWVRYSEVTAAIEERAPETWRIPGDAELRQAGEKFAAAAIPLEALARLAGRDELIEQLDTGVVHLGTSIQLMNDLVDLEEDARRGRWSTATARIFGDEGRGTEPDSPAFWRRALVEPGLIPLLQRAREEQRQARACLGRALDWPAALGWYLDERASWIDRWSGQVFVQGIAGHLGRLQETGTD